MKKILWFLFILILVALGCGIYIKNHMDFVTGEHIIGFTVLTGAFLYLPLFLYHRWKDKRLKDYTLSDDNLKKIKDGNYK